MCSGGQTMLTVLGQVPCCMPPNKQSSCSSVHTHGNTIGIKEHLNRCNIFQNGGGEHDGDETHGSQHVPQAACCFQPKQNRLGLPKNCQWP